MKQSRRTFVGASVPPRRDASPATTRVGHDGGARRRTAATTEPAAPRRRRRRDATSASVRRRRATRRRSSCSCSGWPRRQFAGYLRRRGPGLLRGVLPRRRAHREPASTSCRSRQLADGDVDFAIAWVPKALATREAGANIVDIAQIFQRSGTLQVSFKPTRASPRSPTSRARTSATGASATSTRSSPPSARRASTRPTTSPSCQQDFNMIGLLDGSTSTSPRR